MDHSLPLSRLVTEEFYALYLERVQLLKRLLCVNAEIQIDQLIVAHESWAVETAEHILQNRAAPESEAFWLDVLSILAKHLCRARIVVYSILSKPDNHGVEQIQKLAMGYPNEFTALDFLRSIHLEIYYRIHRGLPPTEIKILNAVSLESILKEIHNAPDLAVGYAAFLQLPVL